MERIKNYPEFYAFYLTEHKSKTSRILHFIGTMLFFLFLIYIIFTNKWSVWWVLPLIGYGFAWVGHFFFEKNKPATFQYPFWSLISDFKLFFELLTGKQKF
jgi:hypothetical protein